MISEKDRFYDKVANAAVPLIDDHRAGLRDAILSGQTAKALMYIEMIFNDMETKQTTKPKAKPTSASSRKKVEEPKDDDTE